MFVSIVSNLDQWRAQTELEGQQIPRQIRSQCPGNLQAWASPAGSSWLCEAYVLPRLRRG